MARSSFIAFSNTQDKYDSFSDYQGLKPLNEGSEKRFTGVRVVPVASHPCFDDVWFILGRQGEYGAQIEKVAAAIYNFFLGYSTQIRIVQQDKAFYAGSRKIKNYRDWEATRGLLALSADGHLVLKPDMKRIINLGKIAALTEFFADTDNHSGNFGLQARKDGYYVFKIDNEHMFSFEHQAEVEGGGQIELDLLIGDENVMSLYLKSAHFLEEKQEMLKQIASTDFEIISAMLRHTVTSSRIPYARETILSLLAMHASANPGDDVSHLPPLEVLDKSLREIETADPVDYGIEAVIKTLREKHARLRESFLVQLEEQVRRFPRNPFAKTEQKLTRGRMAEPFRMQFDDLQQHEEPINLSVFTSDDFKQAITNYFSYKDRFFFRWFFCSHASYQALLQMKGSQSDQERFQVAQRFVQTYGGNQLAKNILEVVPALRVRPDL